MASAQVTGRVVLAALITAAAVTACSAGPPYHRNPSDAAACAAYATAAAEDTPLANIDAISAGAHAQSGELGNLIVSSMQRYGTPGGVISWCNAHGYPVSIPGQ